jgi:hypothetical protein
MLAIVQQDGIKGGVCSSYTWKEVGERENVGIA